MTNTKRKPKPMTRKQITQYQELWGSMIVQAELIVSIFVSDNSWDDVAKVEFDMRHPNEPWIDIWLHWSYYGGDCYDYFSCPNVISV